MQKYENSGLKIGISIAALPSSYAVQKPRERSSMFSRLVVRCRSRVVLLVSPITDHLESSKHLPNGEES